MADFDIKEIASLKRQLRIIEKLTLAGWILIIAGFYYDWESVPGIMLVVQIVLYILKGRLRKKLKQKEYLAKIVEERTIELRIQRDQVLKESEKLSQALDALAKAQDELVRKEKLATVGQLTQGSEDFCNSRCRYGIGCERSADHGKRSQQGSRFATGC